MAVGIKFEAVTFGVIANVTGHVAIACHGLCTIII
jgi:hypothetical protein